jgi:hypothetical protein
MAVVAQEIRTPRFRLSYDRQHRFSSVADPVRECLCPGVKAAGLE